MKKYRITMFILSMLALACSDAFLHQNNELPQYLGNDTIWVEQSKTDYHYSLVAPINGAVDYQVRLFPKWMSIASIKGKTNEGAIDFRFQSSAEINSLNQMSNAELGHVVFELGTVGLVGYPVINRDHFLSETTDAVEFNTSSINFGFETSYSLSITNNSNKETYSLQIVNCPSWLNVSSNLLQLYPSSIAAIEFACNRTGFSPGLYSGEVVLKISPSERYFNIHVQMNVESYGTSSAELTYIEGKVAAANYIQNEDLLIMLIQNPNCVHIIDFKNNTSEKIDLVKTPSCMSLSEDLQFLAVGNTVASVIMIDLKQKKVIREFEPGIIPFSLVLANDNWCFIAPKDPNWSPLRSLNLQTGTVHHDPAMYVFWGSTNIYRIPGTTTILGLSEPSNFAYLFDYSTDSIFRNNSLNSNVLGEKAWFSYNQKFMISSNNLIYKIEQPEGKTIKFSMYAEIENNNYSISGYSDCPETQKAYISTFQRWSGLPFTSYVMVYSLESFSAQSKIWPASLYSSGTTHNMDIHYVFISSDGKTLRMINAPQSNNSQYNQWVIETKTIQ